MTRKQPSRAGTEGFSRARVRARRVAVTLVALLVAGELAGCAGIANPYQTASTATRTTSTPTAARRRPIQAIPRRSATEASQAMTKA